MFEQTKICILSLLHVQGRRKTWTIGMGWGGSNARRKPRGFFRTGAVLGRGQICEGESFRKNNAILKIIICLIWHLPRFKLLSPKIWEKISQSNTTKTRRTKPKKSVQSFTFLFLATERAQTTSIEPNRNKNKIIQPLRPLGVQPHDWWTCLCIKFFVKKMRILTT